MPALEEVKVTSFAMGGASEATPMDLSIEQPVERADDSPTADDQPTESVSFSFGQVKVSYLGNSTSSADGGHFLENTSELWTSHGDATLHELVLGTDANQAAESGHAKWIEVESTTFGASGSGHTGGANVLLADGNVRFDPAEFFAPDDNAAGQSSNGLVLTFQGDRLDPAEEPPSIHVSDYSIGKSNDSTSPPPFYLKLHGVDGDSGDVPIGHERYTYGFSGNPPAAEHPGGVDTVLLDGSVRSISPATDAAGGLNYSGESGGMGASQTGHYTQMMWDDPHQSAAGNLPIESFTFNYSRMLPPDNASSAGGGLSHGKASFADILPTLDAQVYADGFIWRLDRVDQHADAAGHFFAYDAGFLGGVNVGASAGDAGFGGDTLEAGTSGRISSLSVDPNDPFGSGGGDDLLIGGTTIFEGDSQTAGAYWDMHDLPMANQEQLGTIKPLSTFTDFDLG